MQSSARTLDLPPTGIPSGITVSAWAMSIALIGTLVHASDAPVWRADLATLSGEHSGSLTGELFPQLARALTGLPLGSRTLRTALIGSIASALSAALLSRLFQRILARDGGPRRMDPWLALSGSLGVVFSFPFITDATISGGGSAPAAAFSFALVGWILGRHGAGNPGRCWDLGLTEACLLGLSWGLLLSESPWCALALVVLAASQWRGAQRLLPWLLLSGSGLGLGLVLLGVRAFQLSESELHALRLLPDQATWPPFALSTYLRDAGFVCAFGAATLTLLPGRQGRVLVGCLSLLGLDLLVPASAGTWLEVVEAQPSRGALHLLALASVALLGVLGLRRLADLLTHHRLLAAEKGAALLTLLAVGAAVAGIEDASRLLSQTEAAGPSAWTTAALHPLPRGAVVLTHTPAVSGRLRAAQLQGERPDILVVPLDSLAQAGNLRSWLAQEPALKQLIVDMSVEATSSERALSLLSDRRAVYVEADPAWDLRLLAHLYPSLPLARFSPHAIGNSDRLQSIADMSPELGRIFAATERGLHPDRATRQVLAGALAETHAVLVQLGDRQSQQALSDAAPPQLADLARLPREGSKDAPAPGLAIPPSQELVAR